MTLQVGLANDPWLLPCQGLGFSSSFSAPIFIPHPHTKPPWSGMVSLTLRSHFPVLLTHIHKRKHPTI